jgi:hypothetical protein
MDDHGMRDDVDNFKDDGVFWEGEVGVYFLVSFLPLKFKAH